VAVSEAVSNAIIHGYESRPDREVSLSAILIRMRYM
jgi:anti-sigma regulatory factor (Ser/Thr protein kinase)